MSNIVISTFYKFITVADWAEQREPILRMCKGNGVKGSILLAEEGINATIAGKQTGMDVVLGYLQDPSRYGELVTKTSYSAENPFLRMKVRLKKEIVTFGQPDVDPNAVVGTYVAPSDWNTLISDPDVVVIDTRNDFEVNIGSFERAINPKTTAFGDFADYAQSELDPAKHKKIAMFCTGGIRCEKATSYLLQQGFENVFHLEGGILKYLEEVDESESLWHGECFVFDNRVTVDHALQPGQYVLCHACWQPVSDADLQSDQYEEGVSCPRCFGTLTEAQLESRRRA